MIIYLKTDTMAKWHVVLVFAERHGYTWFKGEKPTSKFLDEKGAYLRLDINTKTIQRVIEESRPSRPDGIIIEVI